MGKALASTTIELEGTKTIQFQPDNMEGVDSSNLYKICKGYIHDKANQKEIPYVAVNFKKNPGLLYIYEGIHPKVYQEFREAPSKGQFLNREIIPSAKSTYKVHIPGLR